MIFENGDRIEIQLVEEKTIRLLPPIQIAE
jgi:hypothetical protein